jgi:hypothetical protein
MNDVGFVHQLFFQLVANGFDYGLREELFFVEALETLVEVD